MSELPLPSENPDSHQDTDKWEISARAFHMHWPM
jgi:hypothetical protein